MISRRDVLAATAAGAVATATTAHAATFGNPDEPPQGAINAKNPASITDPGPQNQAIAGQFPSAVSPPPTDVGSLQMNWATFNNAPRRIQNGGWARQVTQDTFPISDTISGVNMRLTAGGIREFDDNSGKGRQASPARHDYQDRRYGTSGRSRTARHEHFRTAPIAARKRLRHASKPHGIGADRGHP